MSSILASLAGAAIGVQAASLLVVRGAADLQQIGVTRPLLWNDVLARQGTSVPRKPSADADQARARAAGVSGRPSAPAGMDAILERVPRKRKPWDLQGQWKDKITRGQQVSSPFGSAVPLEDVLSRVPDRKTGVGGSWARLEPRRPAGFDNRTFTD
ncbi:hypothetical protein CDCA_CDCA10G2924 [Cyanidium caldarium]|uniref:Uncharacterized protein n=1 Tax=Cyanidium caldarium TaxID=2771 RepID=A0AAV9IXR2_CYACA|nr:hypothetical protein CDCA_CDCA10G2924 [Cyanidium caldarium]